jgi:hypothetical protein
MRTTTVLFALVAAANALVLPGARGVAAHAARAAVVQMSDPSSLGYQTEAGSQDMLRQMELSDDIMMLRVAASRAATEKDGEAQRTLLIKCDKIMATITNRIAELKVEEKQLTTLLRTIDEAVRAGKGVYSSEFEGRLAELRRTLG